MRTTHTDSVVESLLDRMVAARVAILFFFHAAVFSASYAFAYIVRFEFTLPPEYIPVFKSGLPFVVGTQLFVGALFGFYRGWWRYVGIADVIRLVAGLTTSLALLLAGWYVSPLVGGDNLTTRFSRGALLVDWAFALLVLFGARVLIRLGRDRFRGDATPNELKRILIIGAGDAGEALAREIEHRPQLGMKVVGFVDDQRAKWGSVIRNIEVTGPISNVAEIADADGVDEALIAIPSASGKRIREIIHHLSAADLPFRTIPGIDQIVSGRIHVSQLRPVNAEDLIRRARIELPGDPVRAMFSGKRVLVTGAGGTIGAELASQIMSLGPEKLTLVERSEYLLYECHKRLVREAGWATGTVSQSLLDVQNTELVRGVIGDLKPHIVLHAAAHKHVPLGEANACEYVRNNALATQRLAEICAEAGADRFVMISTDKAINPTSVMGASKRAAEILLLNYARETKMVVTIVRFGNVIGSSGSVIPLFMEQIAAGGPVTVTHPDATRYFIRTSEAISLVLQAATLGNDGHVFMLDMGEPVKIADLARDLIHLSNHTEDEIPLVFTGLRPGEKMFEEIILEGENYRPTVHPQIRVTIPPQPEPGVVNAWLALAEKADPMDPDQTLELLRRLVPEYARTSNTASVDESERSYVVPAFSPT